MFIINSLNSMKSSAYIPVAFLILLIAPIQINSQELDMSLLSELSEEQLSSIRGLYSEEVIEPSKSLDEIKDEESLKTPTLKDLDDDIAGKKYGYGYFSSIPTSTSAVGDLPLPMDYKISIRDRFTVILSGSKEAIFDLEVKLDGTILFPEIGSISVVGETFSEVKSKLSNIINQSYIGVQIDLSLKELSAKKITIVGAVNTPGTYLVNPFSTITSALAYSGGISEIGTLREIKLIRVNGDIYTFDLYELLINGDRAGDLNIEAGDTILINSANQFVELKGDVKRPAIYEILEGDNLETLINFGLGFKENANTEKILVTMLDKAKNRYIQTETNDFSFDLNFATSVSVFPFRIDTLENIFISGAVQEPGQYLLKDFKFLEDVIANMEFVNAYPWLAILEKFNKDQLKRESILFSLDDPSSYKDIELVPNSKIFFLNYNQIDFTKTFESDLLSQISIELISDYSISILYKEDRYILPVAGRYNVESLTDFIGLDMSAVEKEATYISPLDDRIIIDDYKKMSFEAKRFNTVQFRSPVNNLIYVKIEGEIEFPGTYALKSGSSAEDLYMLVGDFKDNAFLNGIVIQRDSIREAQKQSLIKSNKELSEIIALNADKREDSMTSMIDFLLSTEIDDENLGRIAGDFSPDSDESSSFVLNDGDTIFVPKINNLISVVGQVLNPSTFSFSKRMNVSEAVTMAGGYSETADRSNIYVIRANGEIFKPSRNVFSGKSSLSPGDTIVIPIKINQGRFQENIIPITAMLSNLAFSASALENLRNN